MKPTIADRSKQWWNNLELVERPADPRPPTLRQVTIEKMEKTLQGKERLKAPKEKLPNLAFLYMEARKRKLRMRMETNGAWIYLRWEKPAGR